MPDSPLSHPSTETTPPTPSLWDVDLRRERAALDAAKRPADSPAPAAPARAVAEVEQPADSPADEQVMRDKTLVVRLTLAEREAWHDAAAGAGWGKTAAWVRMMVNGWIENTGRRPWQVADEWRAERDLWRREFSRLGNNLNQLTWKVNAAERNGTAVGHEVAQELHRLTRETRQLRAHIEKALPQ